MLNEMAKEIHATAQAKGFWRHEYDELKDCKNPSIVQEKIALCHSELSEALDALRDGDDYGVAMEFADTIIRVLDLCAYLNIDIDKHFERKMFYNKQRDYLHGRNF